MPGRGGSLSRLICEYGSMSGPSDTISFNSTFHHLKELRCRKLCTSMTVATTLVESKV